MNELREQVRQRYARAAAAPTSVCCDGHTNGDRNPVFGAGLYGEEAAGLPDHAVAASLGCGNPTAMVDLHPGAISDALSTAGFTAISIEPTHAVADRMHAAIIRATR